MALANGAKRTVGLTIACFVTSLHKSKTFNKLVALTKTACLTKVFITEFCQSC